MCLFVYTELVILGTVSSELDTTDHLHRLMEQRSKIEKLGEATAVLYDHLRKKKKLYTETDEP